MAKPIPPEGKKRQRVPINYQSDLGSFFLIRVDLLIDINSGEYLSPATDKFFEAESSNAPVFSAIAKRDFTQRKAEICRQIDDKERLDSITVPFTMPTDINEQIQEIITEYPSLRLRLLGELQQELIERSLI